MKQSFELEQHGNTYKWIDTEPCPTICNGACRECPKSIKYEVTFLNKKEETDVKCFGRNSKI